jgi:hypothetical protein
MFHLASGVDEAAMLATVLCESPPALRCKLHGSVRDFPFIPFGDFDILHIFQRR